MKCSFGDTAYPFFSNVFTVLVKYFEEKEFNDNTIKYTFELNIHLYAVNKMYT